VTYYEIHQWVPDEDAAAGHGYWVTWTSHVETLEEAREMVTAAVDNGFRIFKIFECREVTE